MDEMAQNSTPLNLKSRVHRKKDPYREVRRPRLYGMAWESKRGLAPKGVS